MKWLRYMFLTLLIAGALAACGTSTGGNTGGTTGDGTTGGAVTQPTADADEAAREGEAGTNPDVSNVDDNAENYYGQNVTVQGDVIQVYNGTMFRIDDPELFGGDDVLVLAPNGGTSVAEGQRLEISGTVQQYDQTEIEQALGIDIDDALMTELDGQPVIVAESVSEVVASR